MTAQAPAKPNTWTPQAIADFKRTMESQGYTVNQQEVNGKTKLVVRIPVKKGKPK